MIAPLTSRVGIGLGVAAATRGVGAGVGFRGAALVSAGSGRAVIVLEGAPIPGTASSSLVYAMGVGITPGVTRRARVSPPAGGVFLLAVSVVTGVGDGCADAEPKPNASAMRRINDRLSGVAAGAGVCRAVVRRASGGSGIRSSGLESTTVRSSLI